ncbi:MAG: thiamine pyrophosphate-binding protein [Alphaproteobacteria bacterium]|nr:thiamine pyrophosphate-binding protein [Alphaproteobacteria bacterium]
MKQYCDGGEAILEAFRSLGLDYIISSPGSEWSPVWEALARQKVNQKSGPAYIDCWHETLAVDMAMGYTQMTGHMQAVLLHAGAGLLQGSAGMHSAMLAEVPMVIMSGESTSFGEDPHLAIEPQWYRSLSIVGGPQRLVEPVTKWATQAGNVHTLYEHVVRAGEFAQRTPMGPVYLNAPLEVMLQEWTPRENPRRVPPPPKTRAKDADVEKIAELLTQARNPIILTDSAGRDPDAFMALVELADLFGIPVGGRAAFANFPKNHPLHLGSGIQPFLKDADLVLLVACRAPWYPPSRKPTTGTVVAIDENPFKGTMVYQSLQADHYLEGEVAASLRLLVEAAKAAGVGAGKHADRRARWQREHDRIVAAECAAEAEARTKGGAGIDPLALAGALREAMPADAVYVEETITHAGMLQQHLAWSEPQSFFRAGGGLGQGLGTALGVKLGAGNRPVAALVGDGSLLYNPVVQALGAARGSDLPILIVVCNNGQYRAMQTGHLHHYPDGVAQEAEIWHGVTIDGPDYAELGKPFGLHGQKVDRPAELPGAIRDAMRAVEGGKTAILNVVLSR